VGSVGVGSGDPAVVGDGVAPTVGLGVLRILGVGLGCVARGVGLGVAEGRGDTVGVGVGEDVCPDCVPNGESVAAGDGGLTSR
jgi:hypothetical protein